MTQSSTSPSPHPLSGLSHYRRPLILALILVATSLFFSTIVTQSYNPDQLSTSAPAPSPTPTPTPVSIPYQTTQLALPQLTAKGVFILDLDSSTELFSINPDLRLAPASTTKIMTAAVAIQEYALSDVLTITREEATLGQTMKLKQGERIRVKDLLYGTLVNSANDAALALALSYPNGGYPGFVDQMNTKVRELGLTNTQFSNVSGLDAPDHFTSARDLATITAHALQNPVFSSIVATPNITVSSIDNSQSHFLYTTNSLLGNVPGVNGVKTGWTEAAGECFVASITRDGHTIITVVLGSTDRFQETQQLIDWTFASYSW